MVLRSILFLIIGLLGLMVFQNCSMVARPLEVPEQTKLASLSFPNGSAQDILNKNCGGCHFSSSGPANIFGLTDPQHLLSSGLVISGAPDNSLMFQSISTGRMPPSQPLGAAEQNVIRKWIQDGLPDAGGAPTAAPVVGGIPSLPTGNSLEAKAVTILQSNCYACHGTGSPGGVTRINDPQFLISQNLIVPGNPTASKIFDSISAGRMPSGGPLGAADISTIKDWISAGALAPAPGTGPAIPVSIPLASNFTSINANILVPRCVACHSGSTAKDGIRLDSYTAVKKYIKVGLASQSKLYTVMKSGEMPPRPDVPINSTELSVLSEWIAKGALNN